MPIPLYLAMTGAEFFHCNQIPGKIGWMACHFSPYGTGLTNCPQQLPPGSLLILNDRTPVYGHNPKIVAAQLNQVAAELDCAGILLDLQQPGQEETAQIVREICDSAPCPVAVSEYYCREANCAVFLTPPLHIPLAEFLIPFRNREIWLEAASEEMEFVITEAGCHIGTLPCPPKEYPHRATDTFSRYHISTEEKAIRFSLCRSREDVAQMMAEAENIRCFVGLYQQFR